MSVQKGTLQTLADELYQLEEQSIELPYREDSFVAIEWRYKRLVWQDKLMLEQVTQLTRIADLLEIRNRMTHEMLLGEEYSREEDQHDKSNSH